MVNCVVSLARMMLEDGGEAGQSRFQELDKKTETDAPTRLVQEHGHHSIE